MTVAGEVVVATLHLDSYGHMYAYLLLSMLMKRTALFLKEEQLEKLQTLSDK